MKATTKTAELRQGANLFVVLALLTAVEFGLAIATQIWALLAITALLKAGLVIQYYMHLPRVLAQGEDHS